MFIKSFILRVKNLFENINRYTKNVMLNSIAASHICDNRTRKFIYGLYGHNIKGLVYPECFIGYGPNYHLSIGERSYCNYRCFFDLGNDIIIGNDCSIAFGVTFCNSYHEIGDRFRRAGGG